MHYARYVILAALCILTLQGCASEQTLQSNRIRSWSFEQAQAGSGARVAFVPKGIFLVGLKDDKTYDIDTWVRIVPGDLWPQGEPKPTMFIGRVVQRDKTTARLELLGIQPGIREHNPDFEAYPIHPNIAQTLHSISKRLVFATSPVAGDTVATTLTSPGIMQGNEIYGAFDLTISSKERRLAAQNTALMQVSKDSISTDSIALNRISGKLPQTPAFVLLYAPTEPAFDIRIEISPAISKHREIIQTLEQILSSGLPGADHIHVVQGKKATTLDDTIIGLGKAQTDKLDIVLISADKRWVIIDQGLRVTDEPWTVVMDGENTETAAYGLAARAFSMLGTHPSGAWILEQLWAKHEDAMIRAAIAPALANAYHQMLRDDWAFEIALELMGYAKDKSKKEKLRIQASVAAVLAMTGRSSEYSTLFADVFSGLSNLPNGYRQLFAHAAYRSTDIPKSIEYYRAARQHFWTEYDEMSACDVLDDPDICTNAMDNAKSDYGRLWFVTHIPTTPNLDRQLQTAARIDEIGAPLLAHKLWLNLNQDNLISDSGLTVFRNAAMYAYKAQNLPTYLTMMRDCQAASVLEQSDLNILISSLNSMDWRLDVAQLSMCAAMTDNAANAVSLLEIAADIYVTFGDAENAAIALARLSRKYDELGNHSKAELMMKRAKSFGGHSHQKDVLQALKGDAENAE